LYSELFFISFINVTIIMIIIIRINIMIKNFSFHHDLYFGK